MKKKTLMDINEVRRILTKETYELWSVEQQHSAGTIAKMIGCNRGQVYKRIGEITGIGDGVMTQGYVQDAYHKIGISKEVRALVAQTWTSSISPLKSCYGR